MITNTPSLDLVEFIETKILPQYAQFDRAHNLEHVTRVIRNALQLAGVTGADINMVYTIAAYHDLGMSGPRAVHHITGGKILATDARLKRWFTPEQINVMREAVEDHRASASHVPRSLYGKIIAEADSTWTRNTPPTATSGSGFPAPKTSADSPSCATSLPSPPCSASTSMPCSRSRSEIN